MKQEQGFTLIEILIVLTLLGGMVALSFTVYAFGQRAFLSGKERFQLQEEVRNVAKFITKSLRNASETGLSVLDSGHIDLTDGYQYIYLRDNIVYHFQGVETKITKPFIESLNFQLIEVESAGALKFEIIGFDGKNSYRISSQILLNNVSSIDTSEEQSAIKYKKI